MGARWPGFAEEEDGDEDARAKITATKCCDRFHGASCFEGAWVRRFSESMNRASSFSIERDGSSSSVEA